MGVKDLWNILAPGGRRIKLESLEGKVLAIDTSYLIFIKIYLKYLYHRSQLLILK